MSKTSEAVKILIAADDQASRKFHDCENAADKFADKIRELNQVLSANGISKMLGPLTELGGRLTVVGVAAKALKAVLVPTFEGAEEAIKKNFAAPLAEGREALDNLRQGLKDVGAAIADAFADSNFGEFAKKLLSGAASPFRTGAKESQSLDERMKGRQVGFGTRNRADLQAKLQENQKDLAGAQSRERAELGKRATGWDGRPIEHEALKTARSDVQTLMAEQHRLEGLLAQKDRTVANFPGLNVLGKTPKQAGSDLARDFAKGKLTGESPFVKAFGQPRGIIEGIGARGEKQAGDKLAGAAHDEQERQAIIDRNRTAAERRDKDMAEARRLFPKGGAQFDRQAAAINQRFQTATQPAPAGGHDRELAGALAVHGNPAIVARFGGGAVAGGPSPQMMIGADQARKKMIQDTVKKIPRDNRAARAAAVHQINNQFRGGGQPSGQKSPEAQAAGQRLQQLQQINAGIKNLPKALKNGNRGGPTILAGIFDQ